MHEVEYKQGVYRYTNSDIDTIDCLIQGEHKDLTMCPYCGQYHDCTQVQDRGGLTGLSVFCSEECMLETIREFGRFCPNCGDYIPNGDAHDYDGYEEYCESCAREKKEGDEDWEKEKAFLLRCRI